MKAGSRRGTAAGVVVGVGALCGALGVLWTTGCLTPEGYTRNAPDGGSGQAGTTGSAGATGAGGQAGTSGTGAAGTSGITGVGGMAGTTGTTGTAGRGGTTGAAGTTGLGGTNGAAGTTGRAGTTGAAGTTGVAGTTGSGATSGTVLFSDDFENGTSKWLTNGAAGGTATIGTDGSHVYELNMTMSKVFLAAGNGSWGDQTISARIKPLSFTGSSSSYFAGLCGRVADASNFYCVALRSDGKLSIRDGGGAIGTPGSVSSNIATGTWYTVKLEIIGTTINAYLNGTLVDTAVASIAKGGVGLAVENTDAEFDDVTVTAP